MRCQLHLTITVTEGPSLAGVPCSQPKSFAVKPTVNESSQDVIDLEQSVCVL